MNQADSVSAADRCRQKWKEASSHSTLCGALPTALPALTWTSEHQHRYIYIYIQTSEHHHMLLNIIEQGEEGEEAKIPKARKKDVYS